MVDLGVLTLMQVIGPGPTLLFEHSLLGVASFPERSLTPHLLILSHFHGEWVIDHRLEPLFLGNGGVASLDNSTVQLVLLEELVARGQTPRDISGLLSVDPILTVFLPRGPVDKSAHSWSILILLHGIPARRRTHSIRVVTQIIAIFEVDIVALAPVP